MKILVTGGCGFIGSHCVRQVLATLKPQALVNLDALTYAGNPSNLADVNSPAYHFVHGNICDADLVAKLLRDHAITAVLHLAAETHVDRSIDSAAPFIETNVQGTLVLLEEALRYWKELDPERKEAFRFLHVSTDEVYGSLEPEEPAFTEASPYKPRSPYAASKAASDHLVRSFHHTHGLPVLLTNCSNNYGPCQFPEKLIPLMILNALEGRPLPVYGSGEQVRDWLHVEDHCRALLKVLQAGIPGQTYHVGGECEKKNLDVVLALCEILDRIQPRVGGEAYASLITRVTDRPGHDHRYAMDATKIREQLDWAPQTKFAQGLEETVQWYLRNRDWVQAITRNRYQRERLGLAGRG